MNLRRLALCLAVVALMLLTAACAAMVKEKGLPTVEPCGVTTQSDAALAQAEQDRLAAEREALRAKEQAEREALAAKQRTAMQAQYREAKADFMAKIIYFDFDRSELSAESQKILRAKAEFMKKYPDTKVTIEGNCDERGSVEYNLALGERRAEAAKKFLVDLGIDASRISTISYGEENPAVQGHDEAAWAMNRRCNFVVE